MPRFWKGKTKKEKKKEKTREKAKNAKKRKTKDDSQPVESDEESGGDSPVDSFLESLHTTGVGAGAVNPCFEESTGDRQQVPDQGAQSMESTDSKIVKQPEEASGAGNMHSKKKLKFPPSQAPSLSGDGQNGSQASARNESTDCSGLPASPKNIRENTSQKNANETTFVRGSTSETTKNVEGVQEKTSGSGQPDSNKGEKTLEGIKKENGSSQKNSQPQINSEMRKSTEPEDNMAKDSKSQEKTSSASQPQPEIKSPETLNEKITWKGKEGYKGVGVKFHALLPMEWAFDPCNKNHRVWIRFGVNELGDWNQNVVDMRVMDQISFKSKMFFLLCGELFMPLSLIGFSIPYKYVIVKWTGGKLSEKYEYLLKGHNKGNVNRIIAVPMNFQGVYNKYDDVIHQELGVLGSVLDWGKRVMMSESREVEGREAAIKAMMPKWKGFTCKEESTVVMSAQEALTDLGYVVHSLVNLQVLEDNPVCSVFSFVPQGLDLKKILVKMLRPKMDELQSASLSCQETAEDRVLSAVALAIVIRHEKLEVKDGQLELANLDALARSFCLYPDIKNRTCPTFAAVLAQFDNKKVVLSAITQVCAAVCRRQPPQPNWILAMPLIHFLSDVAAPFELPRQTDYNVFSWWKVCGLEKEIDVYRQQSKSKSLLPMKETIERLLELDPLLGRVLFYALRFDDLEDFIPVILPNESIRALEKRLMVPSFNLKADFLRNSLVMLATIILETNTDHELAAISALAESGTIASVDLLSVLRSKCPEQGQKDTIRTAVDLIFSFMKFVKPQEFDRETELEKRLRGRPFEVKQLELAARSVTEWIRLAFSGKSKAFLAEVKVWDFMLECGMLPENLQITWTTYLKCKLQDKLKGRNEEQIIQAYSEISETAFHPVIEECFMTTVDAVLKASKGDEETAFATIVKSAKIKGRKGDRSRKHLEMLFERKSPRLDATKDDMLKSLFTWPLWSCFLSVSEELISDGGSDILRVLARGREVLKDFVLDLASAEVTVKQFNFANKNRKKLFKLCALLDEKEVLLPAEEAMEKREKELKAFEEKERLISHFVNTCQALGKVGLEDLRPDMDPSTTSIAELAITMPEGVEVVYFDLPEDVVQFMKPLNEVKESVLFQQMWTKHGDVLRQSRQMNEELAGKALSLDETVELVIEPVFTEWKKSCQIVFNGFISLQDVADLFGSVIGDRRHLEKELKLMQLSPNSAKNEGLVKERATQILQYTALNKAVKAAEAVERVCEVLGVSESFPAVEKIRSQHSPSFQQQPLVAITSDVVSAGQFLSDMTTTQIDCLYQFAECGPLIKWIREELKVWKELETFVELAGTRSSAEGDFEAFKVAHLRAACSGFSAFLFEIDEESSFDRFQRACATVFAKLERDEKIPVKWSDSQKFLHDFEVMKKSLGSVEVSSFSQVESINSRGKYTVGCRQGETPQDISDCVCLKIKSNTDDPMAWKLWTLSDLQDLQSKLILISGHNNERKNEVDVFVDTLENVMRLAGNLLALCKAGHVGYLAWTESFDCISPLEQQDQMEASELMKRVENLIKQVKRVAIKMERDLKNWKAKMSNMRSIFYYLNYFTTAQLLTLSRELGHVAHYHHSLLPNGVYGLLECIKPYVGADDVDSCMQEGVFTKRSEPCEAPAAEPVFGQSSEQSIADSEALFSGVGRGGFSFLESSFDEDSDNEEDALGASSFFTEVEDEPVRPEDSSQTADLDPEPTPMDDMFDPENDSYLSLKTLGQFLECLSQKAFRHPNRSFPTHHLKLGYPNLVVAPQSELIASVLAFYMLDADSDIPLPSAQEVLLCSSETTVEDVCLFWRRAIKDPTQGRLFCLVAADNLSYEVSREAVEELNCLSQGLADERGDNYRLVVICSSENEDKSYMVSALDQHRRPALSPPTTADLQRYLKQQFQRGPAAQRLHTAIQTTWTPAAQELDSEGCFIRVVYSTRAGVGKSFLVESMAEKLGDMPNNKLAGNPCLRVTISLHEVSVDVDAVLDSLEPAFPSPDQTLSRLIHLDISSSVSKGLEEFLFNLLVLGQVMDSKGRVWRRRPTDMYVLECTWPADQKILTKATGGDSSDPSKGSQKSVNFEWLLPAVSCGSPEDVLSDLQSGQTSQIVIRQLELENFQRAFQYLCLFRQGKDLTFFQFDPERKKGTPEERLKTILNNCGVQNPSWSVVRHFVTFLSNQMRDAELNCFCDPKLCGEDLPGFKNFVMTLLIEMSRDFSTPSLDADLSKIQQPGNLGQYDLRRRWEQTPHPYLFFNEDRQTVTFIGLRITRNGELVDPRSGHTLRKQIMNRHLSTALHTQGFRLQEDYEQWPKKRKIQALCNVMGLDEKTFDPDPSYELTVDNVTKIMAIHMRFRCGIPVVIMGETGCGKTRLIRFMCALQAQRKNHLKNMLLMKVHGGITRNDVIAKVEAAVRRAKENKRENVPTVLFFDEANTTEAVGLIKEVMCDGRVNGRRVDGLGTDLHVIAACNPYRKHTDFMIKKLESAGLGYHVRTGETEDRLGDIPLRQLVYRVHPLPDSMKALVWDFGQLNPEAEKLYIKQIVTRHVANDDAFPLPPCFVDVVTDILAACQDFMRRRDDECSFVSLRDVERAMVVMIWFYQLHDVLDQYVIEQYKKRQDADSVKPLDSLTRSVVLALGVCYFARLEKRRDFQVAISRHFRPPCLLPEGSTQINAEIEYCQTAFLDELDLPPKIGRNHALKENVFMMVVCIDLRIPLFLVGKPGSSKSLAKDVVKNAMRGDLSNRKLFKRLKQVHMVSYQCSPLSTADGIISTFNQCQKMQQENDLERFVACVVLDEVGLAEDSPRLPLKALHPLLDDGTAGAGDDEETDGDDEDDEDGEEKSDGDDEEKGRKEKHDFNHVAFVGISNWALDPAKMNRGILVQREVPTDDELIVSAEGICSSDPLTLAHMKPYVAGMAKAYLKIYNSPNRDEKEFFGLRDFYSLIKMVFSFCKKTKEPPTWTQVDHAVRRNFGGLETIDSVEVFQRFLKFPLNADDEPFIALDSTPAGLIRANLGTANYKDESEESRYLLLLTENYAALTIVRQQFLVGDQPVIIFGSSFSKDQEYTQICRNINRIKVCMATGRTVVLLNLEKLYESLYDALNQYYVHHGGQKFVDLGLGSHRVKCQVHNNFRLILIADREAVYKDYPIPLINRMEKHFLAMSSILSDSQQRLVDEIGDLVKQFSTVDIFGFRALEGRKIPFRIEDAFVGYHSDAAATVVLRVYNRLKDDGETDDDWVLKRAFETVLQCATPDAVARLSSSALRDRSSDLWDVYFKEQYHSSLADFVESELRSSSGHGLLIQVTTHSRLLSSEDVADVGKRIGFLAHWVALQQFDTEHQFCACVRKFYAVRPEESGLLIVVCESGDMNGELVACARYLVQEEREDVCRQRGQAGSLSVGKHVVFVVHLPRVAGGCFVGFQGGAWTEAHIDDLRPANQAKEPSITSLVGRKVSDLLGKCAVELDDSLKSTFGEEEESDKAIDSREKKAEEEMQTVEHQVLKEEARKEGTNDNDDESGDDDEDDEDDEENSDGGEDDDDDDEDDDDGDDGDDDGGDDDDDDDEEDLCGVEEQDRREFGKAESQALEEGNIEDVALSENLLRKRKSMLLQDAVLSAAILFRSCIHGATSRIDDPVTPAAEVANRRLNFLLDLIPEDETSVTGHRAFFNELKRKVIQLLGERDQLLGEERAIEWVKYEAMSQNSIQAGGTFRHSLWLKIVNIVTPILAEIIALIDADSNLSLLAEKGPGKTANLWLKIFSSSQLMQMRYEDFVSPGELRPRRRVLVRRSGYQGHYFQAKFPFSRIIVDELNAMVAEAKLLAGHESLDASLQRLFNDSALGVLMKEMDGFRPGEKRELVKCYLSDFVHMVYLPLQEEDHELAQSAVLKGFYEVTVSQKAVSTDVLTFEQTGHTAELTIPAIHVAYDHIRGRLARFAELIRLDKDILSPLCREMEEDIEPEMTLDTVAFGLYLERLQPTDVDFQDASAKQRWLEKIQDVRSCVETWLNMPFDKKLQKRAASHSLIKTTWTKLSVLRLFFEHGKSAEHTDARVFIEEASKRLWKCLESESSDFTEELTLQSVLKLLNESSQECSKKFFSSSRSDCFQCASKWKDPVVLPCQHVFCRRCISQFLESQRSCPECKQDVPEGYNLQGSTDLRRKISGFSAFRACCTSFFMELVAVYCFNEHSRIPPRPGLVDLLMNLVTLQQSSDEKEKTVTRAFSPFELDAVDNSPVVRSFLLQLLLQHSFKESMNFVQQYFQRAKMAVQDHVQGDLARKNEVDLAVVFVQCFEDAIERKTSRGNVLQTTVGRIQFSLNKLDGEINSLVYLEAVSSARFALCVVADRIVRALKQPLPQLDVTNLFTLAQRLCVSVQDSQIQFFLLKQLARKGGIDILTQLHHIYGLEWLENVVSQHMKSGQVVPDYFVVLGDDYKALREAVARAHLSRECTGISDAIQAIPDDNASVRVVRLLLALYREVTMRQASERFGSLEEELQSSLQDYCRSYLPSGAKDFALQLIRNKQGGVCAPQQLIVRPGQSLQTRAAAAVAVHAFCALEFSPDSILMKPLRLLLKEPRRLTAAYLPTMPDDNFLAVMGVTKGVEGTKWHSCPNGHPYFIDDCGRPTQLSRCSCGAQIGGVDEDLADQNRVGAREHDSTEKGYILGLPASRSDDGSPERDMSPARCAIIRMLMHAALLWASCSENPELVDEVQQIVKFVTIKELPEFLWDHFAKDIKQFARAIGHSPDDAGAVIHQILYNLNSVVPPSNVVQGFLSSKAERTAWENEFCKKYLNPVLETMPEKMTGWMNAVMNDEKVGSNPLIRLLHELEEPPEAKSPPALWRYRSRVTIQHLVMSLEQQFAEKPADSQPRILKLFLREEAKLNLLRHLPKILQLQRMLFDKFHRRLPLHEAKSLPIGKFLDQTLTEPRERKEFSSLIAIFRKLWKRLKGEVLTHGRLKPKCSEDQLEDVNPATPIAYLLPTTHGKGTCAMSLVDFLVNCVHNEFVANFWNLAGLERSGVKVPMNEVTEAQLISYDKERDLMPLVLAHCSYSLEVGKGKEISYNFAALERQVVTRFLLGKRLIAFKAREFSFSKDVYSTALFVRVERKIPQEKLSVNVSRQILSELHDLTDVFSVLSVLDVLIGFVISTGGDKEKTIHEYLHDALKMPEDRGLVSPKAQQCCRLKHILCLWRILTVEKGRRLVLRRQDPFEDFPQRFKVEMDEDLRMRFKMSMKKLIVELFLEEVMELAWLELKHREETDHLEDYSLKDALEELYVSKLNGLSNLPKDVELRHLVDCWSTAVSIQADMDR